MAKFWGTPSANHKSFCWRCVATHEGPRAWTQLVDQPLRTTTWLRSHPKVNPIVVLFPGFVVEMIRFDIMHCISLGVAQWVNAAALLWLCDVGHFGPGSVAAKLSRGWARLLLWTQARGLEITQRRFTPRKLLLHLMAEYTELQSKAWNSRLMVNWLDHELRHVDPGADAMGTLVVALQSSLNRALHVCEAAPRFFDQATANHFSELIEHAGLMYRELAGMCAEQGLFRYPMRPKVHAMLELGRVAKVDKINPRFYHVYADESHLKTLLRCAKASPRAALAASGVRRYLLRLTLRWKGLERPPPARPRRVRVLKQMDHPKIKPRL